MPIEFKLPELGENIETIKVTKVLAAPGAAVAVDQAVLELETDKATIEVPCSVAGTVAAVHVRPDEEIKVGQLILTLEAVAGVGATPLPPAPEPAPTAARPLSTLRPT